MEQRYPVGYVAARCTRVLIAYSRDDITRHENFTFVPEPADAELHLRKLFYVNRPTPPWPRVLGGMNVDTFRREPRNIQGQLTYRIIRLVRPWDPEILEIAGNARSAIPLKRYGIPFSSFSHACFIFCFYFRNHFIRFRTFEFFHGF